MTMAPVGIRCPDHAGNAAGRRRLRGPAPVIRAQRQLGSTFAPVTKALIAINVLIYLITAVQGQGLNSPGGSLFNKTALYGPLVEHGDWWRLITAAFLHANIVHIGFNMFALWVIGGPVEHYLGRSRFLGLYLVAGLAGSAGALLQSPTGVTVGASGAIFGILGALLILEWQATGKLGGQAMTLIVINLAFSFTFAGISWGGHVGGLVGGVLATLAIQLGDRRRSQVIGLAACVVLAAVAVAGAIAAAHSSSPLG
jgi:membrane associated rhomboid family serine protease